MNCWLHQNSNCQERCFCRRQKFYNICTNFTHLVEKSMDRLYGVGTTVSFSEYLIREGFCYFQPRVFVSVSNM